MGLFKILLSGQRWAFLEVWRWCFFAAGLAPIWYLCGLIVHGLLLAMEAKFFTVHQAVYHAIALKVLDAIFLL